MREREKERETCVGPVIGLPLHTSIKWPLQTGPTNFFTGVADQV